MAYIDGRSKEISLDKVTNTTMLTNRGNIGGDYCSIEAFLQIYRAIS